MFLNHVRPGDTEKILDLLCQRKWQSLKNSQLNAMVKALGKRGYVTLTKTTPVNSDKDWVLEPPARSSLAVRETSDCQRLLPVLLQECQRRPQWAQWAALWEKPVKAKKKSYRKCRNGVPLLRGSPFYFQNNTMKLFLFLLLCLNTWYSISFWEITELKEATRRTVLWKQPAGKPFRSFLILLIESCALFLPIPIWMDEW